MKRPKVQKHWTENSIDDFQSRITFDFLSQLEKKMESMPLTQKELAARLGIGESAVSQVFTNRASLNLKTIIKYSRKLGLKVAVLAYEDGDPDNFRGPVNSEIFSECWDRYGRPADFFELNEKSQSSDALSGYHEVSTPMAFFSNVLPFRYREQGSTASETHSGGETGFAAVQDRAA